MKHVIYITSVILIVIWAVGFLGHIGGSLIHLLFITAMALMLVNIFHFDKSDSKKNIITNLKKTIS